LIGQAATGGVLIAADLLLFYLFWEGMLIPLYFMLANFGGPDRGPATLKFVGYTVAGSVLMLLAIIFIYVQAGATSFDLQTLIAHPGPAQGHLVWFGVSWLNPSQLAFLAFALAFAIKMPLVPFHTWLPKLYESCPPMALVFVAGIVSKLGAYGFLRFGTTLFPLEMKQFQWLLIGLALLSILYGAMMALGSTDLKRIIGYASVSHLGFIGLGIFTLTSIGISGALLQMINHGIIIAALFLMVGYIEEHAGSRELGRLSGLEKRMPVMYFLFLIATLAALGMPGLNGFVGEFTIMLGAFLVQPWIAVAMGLGVLLAAWYMLRLHQGLMHEPTSELAAKVPDVGWRFGSLLAPLVVGMVVLGLFPKPITDLSNGSVARYSALIAAPPEVQTSTGLTP
jgi:NADH-quinone oxidoreductase subunit M